MKGAASGPRQSAYVFLASSRNRRNKIAVEQSHPILLCPIRHNGEELGAWKNERSFQREGGSAFSPYSTVGTGSIPTPQLANKEGLWVSVNVIPLPR